MKRLLLLLIVFPLVSVFVQAQRSKVISVFQLIETSKYEDAKKAIEEAINDEKTKEWPKTWYTRGVLCQTAYEKKKTDLYPDQLTVAFESYEKALELDPKGRIESQLAPMYVLLANEFQKTGERHYNSRKYKDALKAFEQALKINRSPILSVALDTNLVYNTALAAYETKDWDKAIGYLGILHSNAYSSNTTHLLYGAYLEKKDTASAERVLIKGVERFNYNEELVLLLVDILFKSNQSDKAIMILEDASSKKPAEHVFPYTKGLAYQKTMEYRKAIDEYKEAILLAPNESAIYINIGTCYYNIGVEISESARALTNNKAYLEEKAKSAEAYKSAVEWLEKVYEKEPNNQQVIVKLYQLYNALLITDKIERMKQRIL